MEGVSVIAWDEAGVQVLVNFDETFIHLYRTSEYVVLLLVHKELVHPLQTENQLAISV